MRPKHYKKKKYNANNYYSNNQYYPNDYNYSTSNRNSYYNDSSNYHHGFDPIVGSTEIVANYFNQYHDSSINPTILNPNEATSNSNAAEVDTYSQSHTNDEVNINTISQFNNNANNLNNNYSIFSNNRNNTNIRNINNIQSIENTSEKSTFSLLKHEVVKEIELEEPLNLDQEHVINYEILKNKELASLSCQICEYILIDPAECTECESNICRSCYIRLFLKSKDESSKKCPYCAKIGSYKAKANKVMRNFLSQILINCPKGCNQIIKYDNFQSHMRSCEESINCKECSTAIPYKHFRHVNNEIEDLHKKLESYKIKNLEYQDKMSKEKKLLEDSESEKQILIKELKEYKLKFLEKVEEAENEKKTVLNLKVELENMIKANKEKEKLLEELNKSSITIFDEKIQNEIENMGGVYNFSNFSNGNKNILIF